MVISLTLGATAFAQAGNNDPSLNEAGAARIGGGRFRIDIYILVKSDSCRLDLESKMADSDAKSLNGDLATLRDGKRDIDSLELLIRAARRDKDTALFHKLLVQTWNLEDKLREALIDTRILLWEYPGELAETIRHCTRIPSDTAKLKLVTEPLFPNPLNLNAGAVPQVTLDYSINAPATVTIQVSDIEGNLVSEVPASDEGTGDHTVIIPGKGLKAGVYYVRISANDQTQTLKLSVAN
jgi:hypothetical protein